VHKHWQAKTVTEGEDHMFSLVRMNHPLHVNHVYATESQRGYTMVVVPHVLLPALDIFVGIVSGKAIANHAKQDGTPVAQFKRAAPVPRRR
jgi:hypothetical protein